MKNLCIKTITITMVDSDAVREGICVYFCYLVPVGIPMIVFGDTPILLRSFG